MAGIVISITLVSGIFIAGENLAEFSIQKGLNDVKFDYILTFSESNNSNREDVLNAFNTVKNEYDDLDILKSIYTTSTRAFLNITGKTAQTNWIPETIRSQRGFAITTNESSPNPDNFLQQVAISAIDDILINDSVYDDIISFDKNSKKTYRHSFSIHEFNSLFNSRRKCQSSFITIWIFYERTKGNFTENA